MSHEVRKPRRLHEVHLNHGYMTAQLRAYEKGADGRQHFHLFVEPDDMEEGPIYLHTKDEDVDVHEKVRKVSIDLSDNDAVSLILLLLEEPTIRDAYHEHIGVFEALAEITPEDASCP